MKPSEWTVRWGVALGIGCSGGPPGTEVVSELLVPSAVDVGHAPATSWVTTSVKLVSVGEITIEQITVEPGRGWYGPGQASSRCGTSPMADPVAKTSTPVTLADGEELDLELGFAGTAVLPPGSLVVEASDTRHTAPLTAQIHPPLVGLLALEFGEVPVGTSSAEQVLHLTPTEGVDLCLNDVLGLGDLELLTALPQVVDANAGLDLTFTWTPAIQGPYYGQVSLQFGEIGVLVSTSGRGT